MYSQVKLQYDSYDLDKSGSPNFDTPLQGKGSEFFVRMLVKTARWRPLLGSL